MARARLDSLWWKKNRPDALKNGALESALDEFAKVNRNLERSGDVGAYFKAISKLKSAIAKDSKILRKAKDSAGLRLLSDLEKQAHSESQAKQKQLTIKSGLVMSGLSGTSGGKVRESNSDTDLSQLVNQQDRGWTIIKSNQSVSNAKSKSCQAVPKSVSARELVDWNTEQFSWSGAVRSQGNATPLAIQLKLQYDWGGHPSESGGAFLNNCRLWVTELRVPWGYTIDGQVQVGKPYNAGSRTAPVGAIPLKLTIDVVTSLDKSSDAWTIHCHGNKKREIK